MRLELCLCELIPSLETKTRIIVLMHSFERYKVSSTVYLMAKALRNCEVRLQGLQHQPLNLEGLVSPERETCILYPDASGEPLSQDSSFSRPVTLVVPDGTWNQARKIAHHASALPGVRRVKVASEPPSRYRLRTPDRESRLCTLEAVARALGAIESQETQLRLETLLDELVSRVLITRRQPSL